VLSTQCANSKLVTLIAGLDRVSVAIANEDDNYDNFTDLLLTVM